MRTCPMLWDRPLDDCLHEACRFCGEDGSCSFQKQQDYLQTIAHRLAESEEHWENVMLSMVELTERLEAALRLLEGLRPAATAELPEAPLEGQESAPGAPTADAEDTSYAPPLTGRQRTAQQQNLEGVGFYHEGRLAEARDCFLKAIAADPGCVESLNNLGLLDLKQGELQSASRYFETAIAIDENLSASYANLGSIRIIEGDYAGAVHMYQQALQRGENSSAAWTNLGNAHFRLGDVDQAKQAWQTALALDPGNRQAAANLARHAHDVTV